MRVAAIQTQSGTNIEANLESIGAMIRAAASEGAVFIATPEMTHILQRSSSKLFAAITTEDKDKGVAYFGALAKDLGIHLLIGSLAVQTGKDRAANRSFLFGPSGETVAKYDKIHLFDVSVSKAETWKESRIYDRGHKAVTAKVGAATLGLSICYDLRFASLYRHYAQSGADILCVPAAFTRPTGEAHWETLLRARAIETGSFVIAPAQVGQHEDGRSTWGHSMVIDPWGRIITEKTDDAPGFIIADIDLEEVAKARAKIPAWGHDPDYMYD